MIGLRAGRENTTGQVNCNGVPPSHVRAATHAISRTDCVTTLADPELLNTTTNNNNTQDDIYSDVYLRASHCESSLWVIWTKIGQRQVAANS